MKRQVIPFLIGLAITAIFVFFAIVRFLPIEHLELLIYDSRYKLRGRLAPPQEVVVVGIDDKSIERLGRWPWGRDRIAMMVDRLNALGAKVVMLDIIFSETSDKDHLLAESIKRAGNVVLPVVFNFHGENKRIAEDVLYDNSFPMVRNSNNFRIFPPIKGVNCLSPVKALLSSAKAIGFINMFPDRDGVLRWEVMAIEYDKEVFPSIDLQVARLYLGIPIEAMTLKAAEGIQLGNTFIPTDFWGRVMIHYYGPSGTFPIISASELLEGKVERAKIKDKVVLVGATAVGIYDLRVTPTSPAMPGIEKHANVVASLLHKDFIYRITNLTNIIIIFLTGIGFTISIIRLKALSGALVAFLYLAGLSVTTYYLFFLKNLWVDVSYTAGNTLMVYLVITAYRYATEERYAKRIRGMFSSYVTEKVVNELIKNPKLAKLGGERREVTVLFSDIRGFTTFSERHEPEEVVYILNEYLGEMTNIIFMWDGTLDKFVGDEIVAFWGAPVPQENHAELALRCTLHMRQRLTELQEKWQSEGREPLYAGFGLNTGDVLVGNIGAEGKKMDYTVIGDNVNLGARVEGLTRKYETAIIITESTLNKVKDLILKGILGHIKVKGLDRVVVKGKKEPIAIYEVTPLPAGERSIIIEVEEGEAKHFKEK